MLTAVAGATIPPPLRDRPMPDIFKINLHPAKVRGVIVLQVQHAAWLFNGRSGKMTRCFFSPAHPLNHEKSPVNAERLASMFVLTTSKPNTTA